MKPIQKILIIIIYYLILGSFIYFVVVGDSFWKGFINWIWDQLQKEYIKFGFLLIIGIDMLITLTPLILYRRKDVNKEIVPIRDDIALIIPVHKGEEIIQKTLEHALEVFQSHNIFVIDNGKHEINFDNTQQICNNLNVNYYYIPIGSKTSAIYAGLKLTHNYKYVMQIDDDVHLNPNMSFPIKDDTDIIAYTIGVDNNNKIIEYLQDIEYKMSGITKAYKSHFGSDMFCHGAISLWRRDVFLDVLEHHPMYTISDDWFNGYVSNSLGYKLSVCDKDFILTDVPNKFLISSGRLSGYGNITLFSQRYKRWYRSKFLQLFYVLYYILFSWNQKIKILIVQKFFFILDILRLIFAVAKFLLIIPYFYLNYKLSLIMLFVYLTYSIIVILIFNFWNLQKHERIPIYVICINPLYRLYDSFILFGAYISSIVLYTPILIITKQKKLKKNVLLNNTINQYLENDFSYNSASTPRSI
jgi:hypothetical protein